MPASTCANRASAAPSEIRRSRGRTRELPTYPEVLDILNCSVDNGPHLLPEPILSALAALFSYPPHQRIIISKTNQIYGPWEDLFVTMLAAYKASPRGFAKDNDALSRRAIQPAALVLYYAVAGHVAPPHEWHTPAYAALVPHAMYPLPGWGVPLPRADLLHHFPPVTETPRPPLSTKRPASKSKKRSSSKAKIAATPTPPTVPSPPSANTTPPKLTIKVANVAKSAPMPPAPRTPQRSSRNANPNYGSTPRRNTVTKAVSKPAPAPAFEFEPQHEQDVEIEHEYELHQAPLPEPQPEWNSDPYPDIATVEVKTEYPDLLPAFSLPPSPEPLPAALHPLPPRNPIILRKRRRVATPDSDDDDEEARMNALADREGDIQTLQLQLAELREQLTAKQTKLESRERRIEMREGEHLKNVERLCADRTAAQADLRSYKDLLDARARYLEDKEERLEAREDSVRKREGYLVEQHRLLDDRAASLTRSEKWVERRERAVDAEERELERVRAQLGWTGYA